MRNLIINIIKGYENQLLNAEINGQTENAKWLKREIEEGHKALVLMATYS